MNGSGVCGVDIAGDETRYPLSDFKETIPCGKKSGLNITIPAGESGGPENIVDTVEMRAKQIGHGIDLSCEYERAMQLGFQLEELMEVIM